MTSEQKIRVVTIVTTIVIVATVVILDRARTAEFYSYDWRPGSGIPRSRGEPIIAPLRIFDRDQTPLNRCNPNPLRRSAEGLARL